MHVSFPRLATQATAGCATLFIALSLAACRSHETRDDARAASLPAARVAAAQRGNIDHVLSLAGQFQPYQVVDVHPKVSGYMRNIKVDIGDIVKEGQTLATIEVPELKAQLQQTVFQVDQSKQEITRSQHEISRAEAQHQALHGEYERLLQASKGHPGLIAQQELDNSRASDLSSEAQVDAARASLAAAQQHLGAAQSESQRVEALHNYTHVVAPISGVVVWRYADTGALIQGGSNSNTQDLPIVRLSQSTLLRLRLPVPEADVRFIHQGDVINVRVDAVNQSFAGKVVRFTREISPETRTMETEVDVQNKDLAISAGMYANAMLRLASAQDVVTIPVEAVVIHGNDQVVYALDENNTVHIRQVHVGIEGNKLAEIKSGLKPGERVIIGGQDHYRDGETVTAVMAEEPASETRQETGGTIDLNADAPTDSSPSMPSPEAQQAEGSRKNGGTAQPDDAEPRNVHQGAKRLSGGVR